MLDFVIRISTGIIIVPLSFLMAILWPWWEKASLWKKIVTAPFILPAVGFLYLVGPWWDGLK